MEKSNHLKNIAIVILVLLAAGAGFWYWNDTKKKNLEYINNPQVGDFYYYEGDNGMFSDFKVFELIEDGVKVYENEYEIETRSGVRTLGEEYYDAEGEEIIFKRNELQAMYDEGIIFKVVRPGEKFLGLL